MYLFEKCMFFHDLLILLIWLVGQNWGQGEIFDY